MSPSPLKYRPEIDGLRAIAILAVVFYHAGLGFPGGFVGVDVFFVISGFLITSIILKDLAAGTFSLGAFWERRARRILPAMVVVAFSVLAAGWFLLLPDDFRGLAKSAVSLAVFTANFYFWRTIDYFSGPAEELPLLHTWSLAVEEQFYLVAPFLLLLGFRFASTQPRRVLGVILGGLFLASLAGSIWALPRAPAATFYLLPGRAWELLAGSLLALLPAGSAPASRLGREAISWTGLAGILGAVFFFDDETPFPGAAALLPCLGTALVIFAHGPHARRRLETPDLTSLGRLLALKPVVAIGLISYSLYLWHWPIFAFARYFEFDEMALSSRWIALGGAFLLAALSWRFVETPFRVKRLCATRGAILAFAGAGLAALLIAGVCIDRGEGIPGRLSAASRHFAAAQREKAVMDDKKIADVQRDTLTVIGVKDAKAPIDVLVWGDSHARAALPAFDAFCAANRLSGRAVIYSATFPLLDYYAPSDFGLNAAAIPYAAAILAYVRQKKIPNVFLVARWDFEEDRRPGALTKALPPTIAALRAAGARVFILLQVPSHPVNVPRALALDAMVQGDANKWQATAARHRKMHAEMNRLAAQFEGADSIFLDPAPAFATADGRNYKAAQDGNALYRDKHHLTRFGALAILTPFLERTAAPRLKLRHDLVPKEPAALPAP